MHQADLDNPWQTAVMDPARLLALKRSGLIGMSPEDRFDRYIEIAVEFTCAERGCIALVDSEHTAAIASCGFPEGSELQAPIEQSFCRFVIGSGRPFIVDDSRSDPRTVGDPAIDLFGAGAWAGYGIEDGQGELLGTFCVMDSSPHEWSPSDLYLLATLAKATGTEIELIRSKRELDEARREIRSLRLPTIG